MTEEEKVTAQAYADAIAFYERVGSRLHWAGRMRVREYRERLDRVAGDRAVEFLQEARRLAQDVELRDDVESRAVGFADEVSDAVRDVFRDLFARLKDLEGDATDQIKALAAEYGGGAMAGESETGGRDDTAAGPTGNAGF